MSVREATTEEEGEMLESEFDDLAKGLRRIQRLLGSKQAFAQLARAVGTDLTRQSVEVLVAVGEERLPVAEVAGRARMDIGATSRQLRELEKKGYVTKKQCTEKRTVVLVAATKTGLRLARRVKQIRDRHLTDALVDWKEADRRNLAKLLGRLVSDLQETPFDLE